MLFLNNSIIPTIQILFMSALEKFTDKFKEFKLTSWSVKNRSSIYLLMLIITIVGVFQFMTLPKEQFPDIVIPTIYVQTINVGNSPKDIENLITQPIEKQIKGITGAKITKTTSTSVQDFSAIMVEFDANVKVDVALQKVKDAVDKAKQDLPTDLTQEPTVQEVSFSDQPIMYVNVSGDFWIWCALKNMPMSCRTSWNRCRRSTGLTL